MNRNPDSASPDPTGLNELVGVLRGVLDRLQAISSETTRAVVDGSAAPDQLTKAYAALANGGSAAEGRIALREALVADGISEEAISMIDAMYLRCVVGGPIANPL